jgi:hypothetical protein
VSIGGGTPERLAQLVEIDLVEEMADRRFFHFPQAFRR